MSEEGSALRLDKWLWYARFFKSRSLASALCASGKLRLDGEAVTKAHAKLRPGAVITFPQGDHIRVIKVLALGSRRGPAPEAQALYEDLSPPSPESRLPRLSGSARSPGAGRPTKSDRRALERLRKQEE